MASTESMLTMYRKMQLARRFEEKAGQAYGLKKIQGFCHLYIGQEAVVVGVNEAIRPDDYVMTGYRDHVHPRIDQLTRYREQERTGAGEQHPLAGGDPHGLYECLRCARCHYTG